MLFGCIHVFDFPVQALLRHKGTIAVLSEPVAVLDGPEKALKVFSANAAARRLGIDAGMKKRQAEAYLDVMLRRREAEQEQIAQSALLDCGHGVSSHIESTAPGTILANLTGTERLFGTAMQIATQLQQRATACGFQVNVAMASNPDAALHAARGLSGITVIPDGEESRRLASLAIDVLEPGEEIRGTLNSWGIHTFKALAELPKLPLIQRLGQPGLYLQRLAKGEVQRELVPAEPPVSFHESMELEEAAELLEPLETVLDQLLQRLTLRLSTRSLATDCLQLDLELETHADRQLNTDCERDKAPEPYRRVLKIPVPTQEARILFKLLQLDLAAHPPRGAVRKVRIEAFPARIQFGQAGLFQSLAPEPAKLEITLARLRAVVGEKDDQGRERVGFAAVADSHQADSFQVFRSSEAARAASEACAATESQTRTLARIHMFRPPLPAAVSLKGRIPEAVIFEDKRARVLQASGPWRSSGGWWNTEEKWSREEWDLELKMQNGRGIYRVVHHALSKEWFVDGMYDSGELLQVAIMGPKAREILQQLQTSSRAGQELPGPIPRRRR